MLRLVTFGALLCVAVAQNGYDYNRPGKPFSNGKPFSATTTPGKPGNNGAGTNGYPSPTLPSFPGQTADEGYPTTGAGPTPNYTPTGNSGYPTGPNQGFQGTGPAQNYPETSGFGQGGSGPSGNGYQGQNNGNTGYQGQNTGFQGQNTGFQGQNNVLQGQNNGLQGQNYPQQTGSQSTPGFSGQGQSGFDDNGAYEGGDFSAIPGEPDRDYPILSEIPETSFRCDAQAYPGYYADVETRCQVFHVCANNRTFDFLCPNGTIFSQEVFVCVWWNQFDCNSAPSFFDLNANLYDYSNSQNAAGSGNGYTGPQGGSYPSGNGQGGDFPSATGVQAPGYSGSGSTTGYTGASGPSYTGGAAPSGFQTTAQGSYPTSSTPTGSQNGYGAQTPTTFPSGNGYTDNNGGQTPTSSYPTSPNGGLSRQSNGNGNQGYPSGRPNGPSFSSGRPGGQSQNDSGFPPKPHREYLPPRN